MMQPFVFFASSIAKAVLPDAVGPKTQLMSGAVAARAITLLEALAFHVAAFSDQKWRIAVSSVTG